MLKDAQPAVGGARRTSRMRPGSQVKSTTGWGGVTSKGPSPREIAPSSLSSRRKAVDAFSVAMMIINFKKFKSIHFSLKFEVCQGSGEEGMGNAGPAGGSSP